MRRVAERKLPVLLVDGNLSRLTQSAARDGRVIISAQVDLSIRKVPQQTLKGTVSGNASATASATEGSGATQRGIGDLQIRAACSAVESAMSGVSSEIASLAK
jgi:hypothetical protein